VNGGDDRLGSGLGEVMKQSHQPQAGRERQRASGWSMR
jgi:hypothetical protein